jgi:hypothetical protein
MEKTFKLNDCIRLKKCKVNTTLLKQLSFRSISALLIKVFALFAFRNYVEVTEQAYLEFKEMKVSPFRARNVKI